MCQDHRPVIVRAHRQQLHYFYLHSHPYASAPITKNNHLYSASMLDLYTDYALILKLGYLN